MENKQKLYTVTNAYFVIFILIDISFKGLWQKMSEYGFSKEQSGRYVNFHVTVQLYQ